MVRHSSTGWALLLILCLGCTKVTQTDLLSLDIDNYQPIEQFVPAYEAINNQKELQTGRDYDIEKTVRILYALELAQVNANNFEEFLDFMARQDYTDVAPDVLEAKRKLFPVLEYTYKLRSQDEQLNDVWMLVRGAARGGETLVEHTSASTLFRAAHGDVFAILGILHGEDADRSTSEAFAQYQKDKELKSKIRLDLEKLRNSYRQYLEDYTPIYKKYMEEYDRLCVEKDQAYLALYGGLSDQALTHAQNILQKYPHNAEAMLLKSMAQILLGSGEARLQQLHRPSVVDGLPVDTASSPTPQPLTPTLARAQQTLHEYIVEYPDRTAPALVLEGLLYLQLGDELTALNRFDQAAVEYPRQAAQLTDMLDAYNMRNYLTKTREGQYLRRLYASTMEGYGLFSPNLLKAKHYADQGDMQKSQDEIFKHFFRRGNQGIYDELLSDMKFCEENLYGPFKSLLLEHNYLDVEVEPKSEWLFWNSDNVMDVSIRNRSDKDLENVRVFLCIHYSDMDTEEYDVVKVPKSAARVDHHSTTDLDTVVLSYPGKGYADIAHIRAIVMTNDRICWVDDVKYRTNRILDALQHPGGVRRQKATAVTDYLRTYSLEPQKLQRTIGEGLRVLPPEDELTGEKGWWDKFTGWFSSSDNRLKMELPRVLIMVDPVFSLGAIDGQEALSPVQNELYGTSICLTFDYEPKLDETLLLYIYTDAANYKATILYRGKDSVVQNIEEMG